MDISALTEAIKTQAANVEPFGAKLKFLLDDEAVFIDGTDGSNAVSNEDAEADCVIITSKETFMQLKNGDLNPMMAVMSGKVKIKGDMGLAMKLQSLI